MTGATADIPSDPTTPSRATPPAAATGVHIPLLARILATVRSPFTSLGFLLIAVGTILRVATDLSVTVGTLTLSGVGFVLFLIGVVGSLATPRARGEQLALGAPMRGRWTTLNSPGSKVPSHGTHGFGQTYAVDLVATPEGIDKPQFGESRKGFLPPTDFPGFGAPILAPADGTVVRVRNSARDHLSRLTTLSLLFLLFEGFIREVLGARAMIGNHVVIRLADGTHFTLAHLQRGSVRVRAGERVTAGQQVGACGNSGNSTEPHLHCQRQDRAHPAFAVGLPWTIREHGLPENLEVLDV